jgi:beta-glucosidase
MGLFEHPYTGLSVKQANATIDTPQSAALARKLDAESIVLLENHNKTLPLKKASKIAVIGPMADGVMNVSTDHLPIHKCADKGSVWRLCLCEI